MRSYTPEPENKFVEIIRIIAIVGSVGMAIFVGALITFGEWITGKE